MVNGSHESEGVDSHQQSKSGEINKQTKTTTTIHSTIFSLYL